jgi:hypothetical protein
MPRKKSKAKKPKETMRQKQMRLRREAAAAKAKPKSGSTMVNRNKPTMRKLAAKAAQARKRGQGGRPLVRRAELDKAMKPSIKRGASALRGRAKAPKILERMTKKLGKARGVRNARRGGLLTAGLTAANAIQDRLLSPAALKRKRANEIRPLTKADMPKLPKGSGSRSGQGGRKPAAKPAKRPMANLPKDYKKTETAAFKGAKKPAASAPKPKPKASRPAAKPAPKKAAPAPKKVTKKVSGVGPVKSGRSYSVQKLRKSVMQQQAAELRKMREASKKRQAADKAKTKKKK